MKQTTPFVITISRQLGCGGEIVGKRLAESLNIYYADREIITRVAEQLSIVDEKLDMRDEKVLSFWQTFVRYSSFASEAYVPRGVSDPTDYELYRAQSEIIEHIANERSAVIIGRCGFHLLGNHPSHTSVFLHADIAYRVDQVAAANNVSADTARRMILRSDRERASYCRKFTGRNWAATENYDISVDTGRIGVDTVTGMLLDYVRRRYL